ncbi:unnamed protein product [Sphagnum jensenii]|uniref:Ribosomal protein L16 n=1 Tax=Sphagnum jensenii TaxID=128206 RepID=A0ABP1A7I5_9BRYO
MRIKRDHKLFPQTGGWYLVLGPVHKSSGPPMAFVAEIGGTKLCKVQTRDKAQRLAEIGLTTFFTLRRAVEPVASPTAGNCEQATVKIKLCRSRQQVPLYPRRISAVVLSYAQCQCGGTL